MTSITAITLNALANDQARIERVANNLANVQTPGYKRELVVERGVSSAGFVQAMSSAQAEITSDNSSPGIPTVHSPLANINRDMRSATLKTTGRPLDIALTGAGYFEVETAHGPAYTRRGDLQIDARGRLVNADGYALLGEGGEISLTQDRPSIDASGRVFDGERQVSQLRVLDIDGAQLRALGSGLYAAEGGVRDLAKSDVSVRQGFLENSNVDTAHEMVGLASHVRHFEAMLRVAQGRDEMLGTAIRKLGEV